jgi:ParB family chromosome partitioning protein
MPRPSAGLGRGIGALIPTQPKSQVEDAKIVSITGKQEQGAEQTRPVDVFFQPSSHEPAPSKGNKWDDAAAGGRIGLSKPTPQASKPLEMVDGARFAEIPIERIKANPMQPRTHFAEAELSELVDSISQIGVLQPIVVRESNSGYELIMGERRWRAATAAGLAKIPAIIRDTEDTAMLRDALLENLHRADLNPLEEATAYRQLLDDFGCSQEELATRIARSRPQITNTLRLLKLPPLVQRRVATGTISAGHARALLGLTTPELMEQMAQQIVAEGLSVRAVEDLVARSSSDSEEQAPRTRVLNAHAAFSKDLASRLSAEFGSNVKVQMTDKGGKIALGFTGKDDLDRLLSKLAPTVSI